MSVCHLARLPSLTEDNFMSCCWETELDFPLRKPKARAPLPHTPPLVSQRTEKWLKFWKSDIPNRDGETWNQLSKNEGMLRKHSRYPADTAIAYASSLGFGPFQSWSLSLLLILLIPHFLPIISSFDLWQTQSDSVTWNQKSPLTWDAREAIRARIAACSGILLKWDPTPRPPGSSFPHL